MEKIAASGPAAIILREKALPSAEYETLARQIMALCKRYGVLCILHQDVKTAVRLEADAIHLPMGVLREMKDVERRRFGILGASCHSVVEAREAEGLGCTYITAGHVFETDCKAGLAPRGLEFLKQVCDAVEIPVLAIGGIDAGNMGRLRTTGAAGACIMSGFMTCENPKEFLDALRRGEKIDEI